MSRRSARLKANIVGEDTAVAPVPASLPQPVEPLEPSATLGPSNTHLTAKHRTVQRKRGRSKSMPNMPLDVLIEIMAYLTPGDILTLSRTTKDLHAFLMRRSSASFWKAAHKNDKTLPPCPADLSEPAYANLLYSAHCHNCFRKNCHDVFWEARVRLCKDCYQKLSRAYGSHYSIQLPERMHYFWSGDLHPRSCFTSRYRKEYRVYSPHVAQLQAAIASMNPEEKLKYLDMQKRRMSEIRRTTTQLQQWHDSARELHVNKIRTERQQSILGKLVELGYQPDVDYMDNQQRGALFHLPEVRRLCPLSPQSWKTSAPGVLSFMKDIREARLRTLRVEAIRDRMRLTEEIILREFPKLHHHHIWPCELLFNIPQLRKLVEPDNGLLDQDMITDVVNIELPPYLEHRIQTARKHFKKLIKKDIRLKAATDPLSLAVGTYFRCSSSECRTEPLTFAQALRHVCPSWFVRLTGSEYHSAARDVFSGQSICEFGSFSTVVQDARRYVQLYGFDPTTATAEDMDSCTIRIKCLQHGTSREQKRLTVHSWRSLFFQQRTSCSATCNLTQASEKEAAVAIQLEAARRKKREENRAERSVWRRVRCRDRISSRTKSEINAHLQTRHGITEPKEDDLFYSVPMDTPKPIELIPSKIRDWLESRPGFGDCLEDFEAAFFDFD